MKKLIVVLLLLALPELAMAQTNLISNSDFECYCLDGWNYVDSEARYDAAYGGEIGAEVYQGDLWQLINTEAGYTYHASAWVRPVEILEPINADENFSFRAADTDSNDLGMVTLRNIPLDNEWYQVEFDFTAVDSETIISVYAGGPSSDGWADVQVDEIYVIATAYPTYLPLIITHTLSSGQILSIPYSVTFGNIITTSLATIFLAMLATRVLLRGQL